MSRDVVFDESVSWFTVDSTPPNLVETEFATDAEEDDRLRLTSEVRPVSTRLTGPQEPPSD